MVSDRTATTGSVEKLGTARSPRVGESAKPVETSASDLLKQAVTGAPRDSVANRVLSWRPGARQAQHAAIAVGALVLGTALGMLVAPKPSSRENLVTIQATLAENQSELARFGSQFEKLTAQLEDLRAGITAVRSDEQVRNQALVERLEAAQKVADERLANWPNTLERALRSQTSAITALLEKSAGMQAASVVQTPPVKPEPAVTGSVAETKASPPVIDSWALRDIYAGVAILEDRKRRIVEVARGDTIPGIGRVEAVERRGKAGIVVTRQGLITPQNW